MEQEQNHITAYKTYLKVWVVLLILIAFNFTIAMQQGAWVNPVIILIAALQGCIALIWFMHLKYETGFLRSIVFGVIGFLVMVILITFIDYKFR